MLVPNLIVINYPKPTSGANALIKIHNEFETTIKKVRSDNESEFKNIRVHHLYDEFGIRHQFSAKYTP
jgi:hypothetical protein